MGFFNSNHNVDERTSVAKLAKGDLPACDTQAFDFNVHLEKLALFLVQTWKDDHPDATANSEEDMHDCLMAVTTELAIAAKAVGGPVSLAILTGGGSAAARAIYTQVFSGNSD